MLRHKDSVGSVWEVPACSRSFPLHTYSSSLPWPCWPPAVPGPPQRPPLFHIIFWVRSLQNLGVYFMLEGHLFWEESSHNSHTCTPSGYRVDSAELAQLSIDVLSNRTIFQVRLCSKSHHIKGQREGGFPGCFRVLFDLLPPPLTPAHYPPLLRTRASSSNTGFLGALFENRCSG